MKRKLCILAFAVAFVFTGCSYNVPDLSGVDNDLAGEYVADALLRHDKHYDEALEYDHALLQPTPTPAPTEPPVTEEPEDSTSSDGQGASANNGGEAQPSLKNVALSDIYGVPGVTVKGNTYQVTSSYGTSYAVCQAKKGKKLLAVNFAIANTSKAEKRVNFQKKGVQAELLLDGKSMGGPLLSIVDGDLQSFNTKIGAGKKKQGVLIFEIGKSVKVGDVKVRFVNGSNESVVSVH